MHGRKTGAFCRVHHLVFFTQGVGVGNDVGVLQRHLGVVKLGSPGVHAAGGGGVALDEFSRKILGVVGLEVVAVAGQHLRFWQLDGVGITLPETFVGIDHRGAAGERLDGQHQAVDVVADLLLAHFAQ